MATSTSTTHGTTHHDDGSVTTSTSETSSDSSTGTSETRSVWETTGEDGTKSSDGWSIDETSPEGTESTHVVKSFDENGDYFGTIVDTQTKNKDGEVTSEQRIVMNPDGSKTNTVTNDDGTETTTTYDAEGNVISVKTVDPKGKEVEQEENEFWDPDIIYGDHKEGDPDAGDFANWGKNAMVSDMKMMLEADPSLEMHVDHFDFIM